MTLPLLEVPMPYRRVRLAALAGGLLLAVTRPLASQSSALRLETFDSGRPEAFFVTSTLVVGPSESILWDAQYKVSDGQRLAERIAATGTRLKAVIISHADHDHYMGAMEIVRRFPGTPVYMAAATLEDFRARSESDLALERRRPGPEVPDSLVRPQLLPPEPLTVDGIALEVIDGLTGDVRKPASAALWIPSLRTVLVSDLAFNGLHAWLGDSDMASRTAWRASLRRIGELEPVAVIAGHKRDTALPDSPDLLQAMDRYLADFDALMQSAATPQELGTAMMNRYPNLALPALMNAGAMRNFKK